VEELMQWNGGRQWWCYILCPCILVLSLAPAENGFVSIP